jgi:hypothetical protein
MHAVLRLEKLPVGEAGIPYGVEYLTTVFLGLCHCKTFVLDKLGPPLGWRIVFHGRRYSNSQ